MKRLVCLFIFLHFFTMHVSALFVVPHLRVYPHSIRSSRFVKHSLWVYREEGHHSKLDFLEAAVPPGLEPPLFSAPPLGEILSAGLPAFTVQPPPALRMWYALLEWAP